MHWHLARARAAATQGVPGQRTALGPVLASLLRAMDKLHAERHLDLGADGVSPGLAFAGEEQDLQEMLGNLLDNACRSARSAVSVKAHGRADRCASPSTTTDPGIAPEQRAVVLQRGVRLDESPRRQRTRSRHRGGPGAAVRRRCHAGPCRRRRPQRQTVAACRRLSATKRNTDQRPDRHAMVDAPRTGSQISGSTQNSEADGNRCSSRTCPTTRKTPEYSPAERAAAASRSTWVSVAVNLLP
jgi:hypothetical protein